MANPITYGRDTYCLGHLEPGRFARGVKLVAPAEAIVEIGHLDGWGNGLYAGPNIFFPWTRGNVHERFVTLVAEGKGRLAVKVGSCRVGFQSIEVEVG